jgi:hypothetical protein
MPEIWAFLLVLASVVALGSAASSYSQPLFPLNSAIFLPSADRHRTVTFQKKFSNLRCLGSTKVARKTWANNSRTAGTVPRDHGERPTNYRYCNAGCAETLLTGELFGTFLFDYIGYFTLKITLKTYSNII